MKFYRLIKKCALYVAAAFTLAVGGDALWRTTMQKSEPLTKEQITEARQVFGNSVDFEKVRMVNGKFSYFQSNHATVTLANTIYVPKDHQPLSKSMRYHELTHVWQNQNNIKNTGVPGAVKLFLKNGAYHSYGEKNCYAYTPDTTKKLTDYNMEQQASIVEHYAFKRFVDAPSSYLKNKDAFNAERNKLETIIAVSIPVTKAPVQDYPPPVKKAAP
jgi:hypothetical protein